MSYSFKPQALTVGNYKTTPVDFSVSINPASTGGTPPIGPEIGPDPRNANCHINLGETPGIEGPHGIFYDFIFGFRFKFPAGRRYHVLVMDMDTDLPLYENVVDGGNMLVGDRKYFLRYHVKISDADTKELLLEHRFDCTGKKVFIVVPDGGLGENFAWMPYAEEFRRVHKADVTCVIGEWFIRLVSDLYPKLTFIPVSERPLLSEGYAAYYCAAFPKDRSSWRPVAHQHFGMQISIAESFKLPHEYLKVRLHLDAPRKIKEPYVCISSMATNPSKYWNYPDGWNKAIRFLKSIGYRVMDIDREHDLTFAGQKFSIPSEAEDFTGRLPIAERIELLQHADFFIGLPSGLSWVAWDCNIPVVLLAGFSMDGAEFPTPYRITNFNYCHGCWSDPSLFFDVNAPIWCPRHSGTPREIECTKAITPLMVEKVLRRIPAVQRQLALTPPEKVESVIHE